SAKPDAPAGGWCSPMEAETLERAYGPGSPLSKYAEVLLSDFGESFPRLPANALDPRLMGGNFMNQRLGRVRLPAAVLEPAGE
ncbi:unnamed protein product, partial [Discosporangium mesarthrocarpum]